jgi:hypothetical protein
MNNLNNIYHYDGNFFERETLSILVNTTRKGNDEEKKAKEVFNNYAINNFYISKSPTQVWSYYALFSSVSGATIKNIRMIDVNINLPYDSNTLLGGNLSAAVAAQASGTTFENCFVSGSINASGNGGICYTASGCSFTKCATKMDHTGYVYASGPGYEVDSTHDGSGITSWAENGTKITNCYSRMTFAGGQTFANAMLDKAGFWGAAGIAQALDGGSSIENCYTTGINTIVDPYRLSGSISKSYYDVNVGGVGSGNGTSRTTDEMTYPENFTTTYIDWDFETIWKHDPSYTINDGYPHFGGFMIWVAKDLAPELLPGKWIEWEVVPSLWVYKEFEWKPITGVWVRKGDEWKSI